MILKYFLELIETTFRPTIRWTDGFQIVVAVLLPAIYRAMGWPMPSDAQDMFFAYIGYSIASLIVLRFFLYAPYAIWRRQKTRADEFELEINSDRRKINKAMLGQRIEKRKELNDLISRHSVEFIKNRNSNSELFEKCDAIVVQLRSESTIQKAYDRYKKAVFSENCTKHYFYSSLNLLIKEINYQNEPDATKVKLI